MFLTARHFYRVVRSSFVTKNKTDWSQIKYFSSHEFDSKDAPGSGVNMNMSHVKMLDQVRHMTGLPMRVNSGYRTLSHNDAIGGSSTSSHPRGYASDIHCDSISVLRAFHQAAQSVGFNRLGSYETKSGNYFIHLDNDPDKLSAQWYYKNYQGGKGDKVAKFI